MDKEIIDKVMFDNFLRSVPTMVVDTKDRKTISANVLLEAIWFNVIDFSLYGASGKFRYVKWDENHKPTKAVYIGRGDYEHQQKCLKFLTQLALDGLTLKDLEEWQNQKLQTEAK